MIIKCTSCRGLKKLPRIGMMSFDPCHYCDATGFKKIEKEPAVDIIETIPSKEIKQTELEEKEIPTFSETEIEEDKYQSSVASIDLSANKKRKYNKKGKNYNGN